jgi:tetratricopeptide (TPR) repeat protein
MSEPEVESLCHRGRAQLQKSDINGAVELFQQASELDPDCCEAHEGLANCAYVAGEYAKAIAEYQRLTQLQPAESRYYTNLGAIHNRIGEHMKAADFLRKAISRNKKCAESFYNLGIAQRKLKQNAMAVSAYKEAIKIDPGMVEAYQNLGNVYVDMGNLQLAVVNFKKALEIRPDFDKARVGLEKAEQQLADAKIRNNPLGRLNAITSTVTSVAAAVTTRELREDERYEDRKCVKHLADEIERLAKGCVEHLRQNMVPAILEVERAMAHGADEVRVLNEAADVFRNASAQWATLRRSLKRKVSELAEHEKFITQPDAKH